MGTEVAFHYLKKSASISSILCKTLSVRVPLRYTRTNTFASHEGVTYEDEEVLKTKLKPRWPLPLGFRPRFPTCWAVFLPEHGRYSPVIIFTLNCKISDWKDSGNTENDDRTQIFFFISIMSEVLLNARNTKWSHISVPSSNEMLVWYNDTHTLAPLSTAVIRLSPPSYLYIFHLLTYALSLDISQIHEH